MQDCECYAAECGFYLQAEDRKKEEGIKSFLLSWRYLSRHPLSDFPFYPIGQNCVTWLPLVTKVAGKDFIWQGKTLPWLPQIDHDSTPGPAEGSLTSLLFTYIQN